MKENVAFRLLYIETNLLKQLQFCLKRNLALEFNFKTTLDCIVDTDKLFVV